MSQGKTKVYIYTRVSTTMQIDGYSLDAQKARMKAYADFNDYQIGAVQGGQITNFEDFDIDFNTYKYLMETRISGGNTVPFSAIALEEEVAAG